MTQRPDSDAAARHQVTAREPATAWPEAFPIGNGRLGAMVHGGSERELIQLNDDTFWSGTPDTAAGEPRPEAGPSVLSDIRAALAEHDLHRAEELTHLFESGHGQAYQPLADIVIEHPGAGPTIHRALDLRTAVARQEFGGGDQEWGEQEAFVSSPAGVLVIERRLRTAGDLRVILDSRQATQRRVSRELPDGAELSLAVRAPGRVDPPHARRPSRVATPSLGVTAAVVVRLLTDGRTQVEEGVVVLTAATWLRLVVASATDAEALPGPVRLHGDAGTLLEAARTRLADAALRPWQELLGEHVEDHARLYRRTDLRLGPATRGGDLPTRERIERYGREPDPTLVALAFNLGRYLTIAGSRRGTMPLTLQGIWNDQLRPMWSCNYTTNINLQMNYWPTLVTGLAECYEPLLGLIDRLSVTGAEVAERLYGAPGWTCHHNTDAWGFAWHTGRGNDKAAWADWAMGGVWLARHLVTHFEFTRDAATFRQHWPALRGAIEFALVWLVEQPDGSLGTAPSTSPENSFRLPGGESLGVSSSTTSDLGLLRDLFDGTIMALGELPELPESPELLRRMREALPRLRATAVTPQGRIAEWSHDYPDADPLHRHQSHLIGAFPGSEITPGGTPALAAAAARSLQDRGLDTTGWSLAWRQLLWARLHSAEGVRQASGRFLRLCTLTDPMIRSEAGGVFASLLCGHPPLQLDGNFGFTAGVAEALLQSHELTADGVRVIRLLPACPWPEGSVEGFRARDALSVSFTWEAGVVTRARLRRLAPGQCVVRILGGGLDEQAVVGQAPVAVR